MNSIFYSKRYLFICAAILLYTVMFCAYFISERKPACSYKPELEADLEAYKDLYIENVTQLVPAAVKQPECPSCITLPIRLVGILTNGKEKTACIDDLLTSKTGQYRIGDKVRGAVIASILSGEVLLVKDGQRITLRLSDACAWGNEDDWIAPVSENSFIVSRERLSRRLGDINELLRETVPVANISDGKIDGFRILSLKKDGIINTAGFRENDIIKKINGSKIDSLKKPIELYKKLRELVRNEEPLIEIEFERNDQTQRSTYRIVHD